MRCPAWSRDVEPAARCTSRSVRLKARRTHLASAVRPHAGRLPESTHATSSSVIAVGHASPCPARLQIAQLSAPWHRRAPQGLPTPQALTPQAGMTVVAGVARRTSNRQYEHPSPSMSFPSSHSSSHYHAALSQSRTEVRPSGASRQFVAMVGPKGEPICVGVGPSWRELPWRPGLRWPRLPKHSPSGVPP